MKKTPDYSGGEFRFPVVVQRPTYTPDDSGGQVTVWSDAFTIFCAIDDSGESENYGDGSTGRIRSVDSWTFTTWFRDDISVEYRLSYDDRLWNIKGVSNISRRNKFTQIKAQAGVEQ